MSYPSNYVTSTGVTPGQSSRYIVAAQAIQPAIFLDCGKMSTADFDAALRRFVNVGREHDRRMADYTAREEAGQTKPADLFKALYGYTDEEAEEFMREGTRLLKMQMANEARSKSRMAQPSRHGRGH
ncbi:hypothetical protein EWM64_g7766 [Hericium alpestre]|uniref:Uncharacterized protein n=1 Tax=Hericium alpestre TaxID=135208 RepID=A0A4Y9ZNQ8_9AGAM|nr:hypothetical protein EWM64_g7766 [Hericium alpestre]